MLSFCNQIKYIFDREERRIKKAPQKMREPFFSPTLFGGIAEPFGGGESAWCVEKKLDKNSSSAKIWLLYNL